MENQPPRDEPSKSQSGAGQTRRARGWFSMLGLLIVLFVVLLGACGFWLVADGFSKAMESTGFQYLGLGAIFVGFAVATHVTARMLERGIIIDKRNVMDLSRSQRFKR
jgi:hypothetical protein